MKSITRYEVLERLEYIRDKGEFVWKKTEGNNRQTNSWNTRYAGRIAGTVRCVYKPTNLCYKLINLEGVLFRVHTLVILMETGEYHMSIDHIDGNGLNNKYTNLRVISQSKNLRKAKLQSNNTSGFKGVSKRKDTGKWTVRLKVGMKYVSLGCFNTKEEAFEAYREKVLEINGEVYENLITNEKTNKTD